MSVTTTANPRTYATVGLLGDYDLHHGVNEDEQTIRGPTAPNAHPTPRISHDNSVPWESEYRRVPPHIPINYELDMEMRNTYTDNFEHFILYSLFHGILIVSNVNKAWRATGGRLNSKLFQYRIGGEW